MNPIAFIPITVIITLPIIITLEYTGMFDKFEKWTESLLHNKIVDDSS
jgi:hypothetical protein